MTREQRRTRRTYAQLAAALALVLAVMAWVTVTLLRLDRERDEAERAAVVEEQVRLSLWRLDSAMTPIIAREVALLDARPAELPPPEPGVVTRFVLDGGSPRWLTQTDPARMAALDGKLHTAELLAERYRGLPLVDGGEVDKLGLGSVEPQAIQQAESTPYALKTQARRNEGEWSQRRASVEDNFVAYGNLARGSAGKARLDDKGGESDDWHLDIPGATEVSPLEAVWLAGELLLIRTASSSDAGARVEGIWLDWPALRERLLEEIDDLLPRAQLLAVEDLHGVSTDRLLATLPARLDPGATVAPQSAWSPLRAALLVGWLLVVLAFVGVVLLLRGSMELSQRRATFVSAVTHELRTPLTTFRMYTEMLGEGMVEPRKRERYVAVLRREAERLSALVENVLAYARIESERGDTKLERLALGVLLERVEERLRERCEAAKMQLEFDVSEELRERELLIDPTAVEQILFNLIDNATKYGRGGDDPRVHIEALAGPRTLSLCVRDFGPGIAPEDRARVFEPFTKAKADAAGTKPGVGLGLALSRSLAKQLGGDLHLRPAEPGAEFRLELKLG